MSLATNVQNLATRVATEIKSVHMLVNGNAADNSALLTVAKGNLVDAINELYTSVAAASGIDDSTVSTASTWSSSKIAARIAALINDSASADSTVTWSTTQIATYVTGEISAALASTPGLDDTTLDTTHVWSGQKVNDTITTAVNALVDGAPAALDTLKELADALGADENAVGTITTALGKRVAVDQAQTFTAGEQAQGRANIGAAASADLGDPTTNFVTVFEAGLV